MLSSATYYDGVQGPTLAGLDPADCRQNTYCEAARVLEPGGLLILNRIGTETTHEALAAMNGLKLV
ncbi:hypothetical protein IPM62_01870 [Candidatus Woesebacteria bacterium]|nr:MAG: hypothetical protein IPM62_01870 [Candidatus Woesebacteria bacterium]